MNVEKDCLYYCDKYIERKKIELIGYSDDAKFNKVISSTFIHLSILFPEAYQHMLKVWNVLDENN